MSDDDSAQRPDPDSASTPAGEKRPRDASPDASPSPPPEASPDGVPDEADPGEATVISKRPPLQTTLASTSLGPRKLGQTLVGRKLAHFQLLAFVGGGGMGAVFRARDTMLDRTVAVKVLARDQSQDDETVKRFHNEAQSAARLDHDNIARVYYVGQDDGWYFIVFEFIDGKNLREYVAERGALSFKQALEVTLQLTAALHHSAQRDVVHRDIKPSNVLLTPAGKAKLVDMGLARLRPMQSQEDDLTASGVTLGTFDYISPEQARDPRLADARSDIYSLGCTLYFMLTAQPPFPDGTVLQKLLSHSGDAPPDPRKWRNDLPSSLIPIMNRMLAKKPTDRYQTAADLAHDLWSLADRVGITRGVEPTWEAQRPRRWQRVQFHLPWVLPAALCVAAIVLLDPTWLDGRPVRSIDPRFESPPAIVPPTLWQPEDAAGTDSIAAASRPASDLIDAAIAIETPDVDQVGVAAAPTRPATSALPLVVDPRDDPPRSAKERVVTDLSTAIEMALSSDEIETIEIRSSDRLEMSPFELPLFDRTLMLTAGEGFTPTISFRTPISAAEGQADGMIQLRGGQLQVRGVHLEMIVPTETIEGEWSLFQLVDQPTIQLEGATVTIHNSYGGRFSNLDHVAVFDAEPAQPGRPLATDDGHEEMTTTVNLQDVVIRCEATVVRAEEAVAVRFQWSNGLLISSERLISLGGSLSIPRLHELVELSLDHVTIVADQGLGEFSATSSRPYLMPVQFRLDDCVVSTQRWSPLIRHSGPNTLAEFLSQLEVTSTQTAYDGTETFWRIRPLDATQGETFDFEKWCSHWGLSGQRQSVRWRYAIDRGLPIHQQNLSDYLIDTTGEGADLGFRADQIPSQLIPDPPPIQEERRPTP